MTEDQPKPSVDRVEIVEDLGQRPKPTESPWAVIRSHPRLVWYAMVANIGPLMFGHDLLVVAAISAIPAFARDYGESTSIGRTVIPALWLGLWNGLVQAGSAIGSLSSGWIQDRYGRRINIFLGGLLGVIGTAISYTSGMPGEVDSRRGLFLLAKIVLGIACGMLMATCQIYISEISPKNLRGVLLGFYAFNITFGHIIGMAVVFAQINNQKSSAYQIPFASQWAFGAAAMVAAFVLPESPVWLVVRGRIEDAQKALRQLGTDKDASMLERIQTTLAHEREGNLAEDKTSATYGECFRGVNRRRTVIILWLNILQQFMGIALISNGAYFLIMAGMSPTYSLMVSLIGLASNIFANMVSWYTIPRFGRRTMILLSMALDIIAWLGMGVAGCFNTSGARWYVGVALLLFGFFNSFGVGSAVPVITSEISCVRLRSKTFGLGLAVQFFAFWVFNFFTPYMYNADEANWGGKIGFFFAGTGLVAMVITWLWVPETKGRTFRELDYLFESKVKSRAFSKVQVPMMGSENGALKAEKDAF